jgi:Lipocalin-like domain
MHRRARTLLIASLLLSALVSINGAFAQAKTFKDQVVGAWTLVSFDSFNAEGKKIPSIEGGDVKGRLILTADGQFSAQIISHIPKLASKARLKTTLAEDKAVAHGVLSFFGTYTTDAGNKTINLLVERSSYPNQVTGKSAKRIVTFTGDEMRFDNLGRTAGGKVIVVWKRIK